MKEIDDTNPTETTTTEVLEAITATMKTFKAKIVALELRLANLETQRTPADNNMDDPEWH